MYIYSWKVLVGINIPLKKRTSFLSLNNMEKYLFVLILIFSFIWSCLAYPHNNLQGKLSRKFVIAEEDLDDVFPQSINENEEDDVDQEDNELVNADDQDEDDQDIEEDDMDQEDNKLVSVEDEDFENDDVFFQEIANPDSYSDGWISKEAVEYDDESDTRFQLLPSSQDNEKDQDIEKVIERNVKRDKKAGDVVNKDVQKLLTKAKREEKNQGKKPKDMDELLKEAKEGKKTAGKKQPKSKSSG